MTNDSQTLLDDLKRILDAPDPKERFENALDRILQHTDCVTGTIHALDSSSGLLQLEAQRGIPEAILERVRTIPIGKGMAGIAAERREAVQVCNLQTDDSGVAKPDAKLTKMEGSVACPIVIEGQLRGTLGVAKPVAHEFGEEEIATLMAAGQLIGERFPS